ncbi:MAG: MFS transporter [Anaerolineales bacterium]|jgi:MFS family permease
MENKKPPHGMTTFILVAIGQIVSVTGSSLTGFALGAWVYKDTHSTTLFALILLFTMVPSLFFAPFAGTLVDRWDRRKVMIAADSGAAVCTGLLMLLIYTGYLEIWHIYIIMGFNSLFRALQVPAYTSSVSLLVPKEQLGRANGIVNLEVTSAYLLSPILAGWLLDQVGVVSVMAIDLATFLFAVGIVLAVRFPSPVAKKDTSGRGSFWKETAVGWKFISARTGFLSLTILFALGNYANLMTDTLIPPRLLEFTSPTILGSVLSAGGLGMLVGTLLMSVWGGPKKHIYGVLIFKTLAGLAIMGIGLFQSIPLIALATFFYYLPFPLVNSSDLAIWQSKVPPEIQGRAFSTRRMLAGSMIPLAYLTAGPLSDGVFKPLLSADGALASSVGQIFGVGPSRGIGLLIFLMGEIIVVLTLAAALDPRVRNLETELPDAV